MTSKRIAVFGIYPTSESAEHAIDLLTKSGFPFSDVSVLVPETTGIRDMGTVKTTKAPEGTAAGASSGAVVGGVLGLLAGIGALAIPGMGPLVAAGPILSALAGVGVGGVVGGLTGALIGLGIPEFEAKRYEGRIKNGGILLSVHCDTSEEISHAKIILERTGAEDVASIGEASADATKPNVEHRRAASGGMD